MKISWKIWPLERSQGFYIFRPTDLVFDPTWPSFELDLDIIKVNILNNFHEDLVKYMASREVTRFFYFRPTDLVFDGTWPSFELDLDIIKMNILTNIHKDPMQNVTSRVVTSKSLRTHGRTDGRRTTDTAQSQKLTLSLCDRWAKNRSP